MAARPTAKLVACLVACSCAHAHETHDEAMRAAAAPSTMQDPRDAKQRVARAYFTERRLVTQDGRDVAFFSDVLKDRVVLVQSMFTQCRDACPAQAFVMSRAQRVLGEAMQRDVRFVSISVDPGRDTPEVLKAYAARFDAGPGWTFLTGAKADVDEVLRRFGQAAGLRERHSALFVAGNASTGRWIRLHPEASPDTIVAALRELAAARVDDAGGERRPRRDDGAHR